MNAPLPHLPLGSGQTAAELFSGPYGRTFDDLIILPPFSAGVLKAQSRLTTMLAADFTLSLPLVSSPMDTVTERSTAIQLALFGGLGIIHFNNTPEEAAQEVHYVKRYQMGIVDRPVCCRPSDPVRTVADIKKQYGFSTVLITKDGTPNTALLGMVTKGHTALSPSPEAPLMQVMIPRQDLITCTTREVRTCEDALNFLRRRPAAHKLPILRDDGSVAGFVTRKDVVKHDLYPTALLDPATGQLRVGAAVSTHPQDDARVEALLAAGVDVLVVDSAQGGTDRAVARIRSICSQKRKVPVIAGNVVTPAQAAPLIAAGAKALRVGMGSGSICTTQNALGVGRAQLSAVYHTAHFCRQHFPHIPVISDGGIRHEGDIVKALACGAASVMVGRFIAGCDETPSPELDIRGRRYKRYRGMGSASALQQGGANRYGEGISLENLVVQGVEGLVPVQGPLKKTLQKAASAVATALEYLGCDSITQLHQRVGEGAIRFELRSDAARHEGDVHDIELI